MSTLRTQNILEDMDEEDKRFREALKRAAYDCEPDTLNEVVDVLVAESKRRQRQILVQHNMLSVKKQDDV